MHAMLSVTLSIYYIYISYCCGSPPPNALSQLHWLWVCGSAGWSMWDLADGSWANCCVNSRPSGWLWGLNGLCQVYTRLLAVLWSRMAFAGMIGLYPMWSDICHSFVQACSWVEAGLQEEQRDTGVSGVPVLEFTNQKYSAFYWPKMAKSRSESPVEKEMPFILRWITNSVEMRRV